MFVVKEMIIVLSVVRKCRVAYDVLPIDYVACYTPVLVGRVIGSSVRVSAEISNEDVVNTRY